MVYGMVYGMVYLWCGMCVCMYKHESGITTTQVIFMGQKIHVLNNESLFLWRLFYFGLGIICYNTIHVNNHWS
jgi:hypothetical protein